MRLIISDACLGLAESAAQFFPDAMWQRCVVHFYRNFFFTADATSADLTFASTVISGGTAQFPTAIGPALDNISIAATPLPAALPLFGSVLGAFGLFSWFRRRLTATA